MDGGLFTPQENSLRQRRRARASSTHRRAGVAAARRHSRTNPTNDLKWVSTAMRACMSSSMLHMHMRSMRRTRIIIPTAGAAPLLTEKGVEVRLLSGRRADAYFFGASEGARPPPQLELGAK